MQQGTNDRISIVLYSGFGSGLAMIIELCGLQLYFVIMP